MEKIKVILTGATGMVGEGVLIECLQNEQVMEVLMVNRRHCSITHPKLKQLIINDFMQTEQCKNQLKGYDACFYCAGISSIGMNESEYTKITYEITLHFAKVLLLVNSGIVFHYVSGMNTDSTEKGKAMWARVKGKTENELLKLSFRGQYNFRPGYMQPFKEQKNVKRIFKFFGLFYPKLFPGSSLTLQEVGKVMIQLVFKNYSKQILEVKDIKEIALTLYPVNYNLTIDKNF